MFFYAFVLGVFVVGYVVGKREAEDDMDSSKPKQDDSGKA
jgi:hypothetical protein